MAYIVFARKYRPQRFSEIIGQDHIVTILKSAVKNNRIPHAMLFSGPRGVGKTTTARVLAKALNCENPQEGEPCLKCKSCIDIKEGNDIDVIEIDGASNRGIDEIRDLREKAKYATFKGKYKIFIIDEVHMLTKEAFNALLKILEEPPEHVIFIFATTEPYNVIPTILSRTQRFDFKRLSVIKIVEQLENICKEENIEYELKGLKLIARLADGSMRDANSILDQIASMNNKITYENVNTMFGRLDVDFFSKLVDFIINKDVRGLIDTLNSVLDRGYDIESFVNELTAYIHKLFLIKNEIKSEEILILEEELLRKAKFQTNSFSNNALMQITKELIETTSKLKFSNNKKLIVENQLARIITMIDSKDIDEIIDILKSYKKGMPIVSSKTSVKKEKKKIEETKELNDLKKFEQIIKEDYFFLDSAYKESHLLESKDNYYKFSTSIINREYFNKQIVNKIINENNLDLKIDIVYEQNREKMKIKKNPLEDNEKIKKLINTIDGEIIE